jgi:hypothetical protein
MSVIVDIAAFSCTTNNESLVTSNPGWSTNSTTPPFGTDIFQVQNSASPVSAYPVTGAPSIGYLRDETPGSANQTVRATLRRVGTLTADQYLYIGARMSAGDDSVSVGYVGDNGGDTSGTVVIYQTVNGTRTQLGSNITGVGGLGSVGATGVLELRVSGSAPTISVSAWWNGTQVGTTQTITDSTLDAVGKVGFFNRVTAVTETTGVHVTTFYAEDDSGPPVPVIKFTVPRLRPRAFAPGMAR